MGLETPTYISDFVTTNPVSSDKKGQGDDHIRNMKAALQATFPTASKPLYFPTSAVKSADFTIVAADQNKTFLVTTAGGVVIATLPTLAAGDAGWECFFLKTNTGTNPLRVVPASGTLQSGEVLGLSAARRCIPGVRTGALWTGTAWVLSRAVNAPVGAILDYDGSTLPVGYELPNGQTLASASTNYPEYNSVKGSGATRDLTGRVVAMKESVATRLTTAGSGVDGATLGAAGGAQTHTLLDAELPEHTHTVTDPGHTHVLTASEISSDSAGQSGASGEKIVAYVEGSAASATTGISVTGGGNDVAHNNVQPTIVLNKILVVE